jgi:hypothetical protein
VGPRLLWQAWEVFVVARLGEEVFLGDASAGSVSFVCLFSTAFGRDFASGPSPSLVKPAAPDCSFPCHCRSGSGRRSFNVLSSSSKAHGDECCGVTKVWGCASALAGELLPGFIARCSSGLARRRGGRRSFLVKSGDLGCGCVVICGSSGVLCVKRVCTVLCAI